MKNLYRLTLLALCLLLAGCSQSLERSIRTTTLVQDNITAITNHLAEIQLLEESVQTDFESTLKAGEDDLSLFKSSDSAIQENVAKRRKLIQELQDNSDKLQELNDEMVSQLKRSEVPKDQINEIIDLVSNLQKDLEVYSSDYLQNLDLESQTYQSIANPDTNFENFFKIFDTIEILMTNNEMNLEKVLTYFESINAHLIDFKVYLTNLQESH